VHHDKGEWHGAVVVHIGGDPHLDGQFAHAPAKQEAALQRTTGEHAEQEHDKTEANGCHGTCTVNCPGLTTEMTPPQVHISFAESLRAGMFPSNTVGAPTTHGAGVTGTQGIGVSTPSAAAVAAATIGLANDMHIPKGGTFTSGFPSRMLAAGVPVSVRFTGGTTNVLGATPKLH
jgi:hypothetical protein